VAAAAVAEADLSPLDITEMALQQILCQQVHKLLHQPGLNIGYKQVGDLKLWGDVSTGTFRPLVPLPHRRQVFNHLHSPAQLHILAGAPSAESSAPGMYGVAWPKTSCVGN
jgi:hypothetical protein